MKRSINLKKLYTVLILILLCASVNYSCKKKDSSAKVVVSGCVDPNAVNYNAEATASTTCHYLLESVAGKYALVDTHYFLRQTGPTTCVPDTSVTYDTLSACLRCYNLIKFDHLISCFSCDTTGAVFVDQNNKTFSYSNSSGYYTTSTGSGQFGKNTIHYHVANCDYTGAPNDIHKGTGTKIQ